MNSFRSALVNKWFIKIISVSNSALNNCVWGIVKKNRFCLYTEIKMPFCVTRETVWKLSKLKQKFLHFIHCVKSVHIRSFSGPSLAAFRLNTERYEKRSISPCSVQMREDTDQENSEHRHFSCSNISYPIVSDNTRSIATFWNPSKREIEGEKTFVELCMSFSGRFSYKRL